MSHIIAGDPAPTNPEIRLDQFSASDRELLTAVFEHEARNIFIHLDDCEDDACTGCDPQHLAEQAAADEWPSHHRNCYIREGHLCSCGGAR